MQKSNLNVHNLYQKNYHDRTPDDYINIIPSDILLSFNTNQINAIREILREAIPKPSPKIVDLRFDVNLIFSQFYIVLFVGKNRRKHKRNYVPPRVARLGNYVTVIMFLIFVNLCISSAIFFAAYYLKSMAGIDIFPKEHLVDQIYKL